MITTYAAGSLISARGRDWVVLPESSGDFLIVRPLGGTADDVAAVLPDIEEVRPAAFAPPTPDDLGDQLSAGLLRAALNVGFRSTTGPFRSFGSLAVEPRSYQLVPLMMAARQEVVRLLIADDVGIGKTIEAGLIAAELLAIGDAQRLGVLCSPALAEQWQAELREKFSLEAELVLASTVRRLQRGLVGSDSIFEHYPITVVSTDFIKSSRRRHEFLRTCPDLIIVDEAHTCVSAGGQAGRGRTQRYELLHQVAAKADRHLILVTATPHSGNEEAFRNLLGLLDPRLPTLDLEQVRARELLARHFVQRRRAHIRQYLDETTPFPRDRESKDVSYALSPDYRRLFEVVLDHTRETVSTASHGIQQRVSWWSALALLRALASSPRAAAQTLRTRSATAAADSADEADAIGRAVVLDLSDDEAVEAADAAPGADTGDGAFNTRQRKLREFLRAAEALEGKQDNKIVEAGRVVKQLLADGFDPIVFCRFIDTAHYVAEELTKTLGRTATVTCITGEIPPSERVSRIAGLAETSGRRVLVATDCLSEGVNLQDHFQAVVHYDLAWNPTRHEQREGRVDRFGQTADRVRAVTIYGRDNQVDGIVLNVLLRKHEEIRKATGVSVPVPDNSDAVLEALMEGLLLRGGREEQVALPIDLEAKRDDLYAEWMSAAERERRAVTKYAQHGIKPAEVGGGGAPHPATRGCGCPAPRQPCRTRHPRRHRAPSGNQPPLAAVHHSPDRGRVRRHPGPAATRASGRPATRSQRSAALRPRLPGQARRGSAAPHRQDRRGHRRLCAGSGDGPEPAAAAAAGPALRGRPDHRGDHPHDPFATSLPIPPHPAIAYRRAGGSG
jgi:superfamily II DNA or RNA helicase